MCQNSLINLIDLEHTQRTIPDFHEVCLHKRCAIRTKSTKVTVRTAHFCRPNGSVGSGLVPTVTCVSDVQCCVASAVCAQCICE